MFFSPDNIWLWVSVALAALTLTADILGALLRDPCAKVAAVIALPLHVLLLAALLVDGAELILAVTSMTVSLLVYTAARALRLWLDERREGGYDL